MAGHDPNKPYGKLKQAEARAEQLRIVLLEERKKRDDWVPLAKALFEIERDPAIKDQAWFDFQGKAQRIIAIMAKQQQD